jgi:hypothetical protein
VRRLLLRTLARPFRLIKDSGGAPSWTHTLAIPFSVLTMLKWLLGGLTFTIKNVVMAVPVISAGDAAIILGVWLAYLAQRDYAEKKIGAANGKRAPRERRT